MPIIKGNFGNIYFGRLYLDFEKKIHFENLKKLGINNICNLLPYSESIEEEASEGFLVINIPISDYDVPKNVYSFIKDLELVNDICKEQKIFIHCFGGQGRTSIIVSLLLFMQGLDIDEVLKKVKEQVKGPETKEQISFIKNIAKLLIKHKLVL